MFGFKVKDVSNTMLSEEVLKDIRNQLIGDEGMK
jgi:hypothetical protein